MTDITERLRGPAPHMIGPLMDEAADEIERLRARAAIEAIYHSGCICPPTSERTCQNPMCPRQNHQRAKEPPPSPDIRGTSFRRG